MREEGWVWAEDTKGMEAEKKPMGGYWSRQAKGGDRTAELTKIDFVQKCLYWVVLC